MASTAVRLTRVETADVLCVILALVRKKLNKDLRFRNYELQRILSSNPEAKELFVFSNSGPEPFSPELEEALNSLSVCGFLNRYDIQDPKKVVIRSLWLSYADRITKRMSERDLLTVRKVSDHIVSNLRPAG